MSDSNLILELLDRTCRTGHDDEVMNRAAAEIQSLQQKLEQREKYEEKCSAITRLMRSGNIEAVTAVITEIDLLFPPSAEGE